MIHNLQIVLFLIVSNASTDSRRAVCDFNEPDQQMAGASVHYSGINMNLNLLDGFFTFLTYIQCK